MTKKIKLAIVIPIYNEELELESSVLKLQQFLTNKLSAYDWEIIVADNASTDDSYSIAKKLSVKFPRIKHIHLSLKGRGRAVKKAWMESKAQILVYMDVDLSTDLTNLPPLVKSIEEGYDLAIGSRLLPSSQVINRTVKREILSRIYNILIKIFFGIHFSDAQCGFKAVSRKAADKLIGHIKDNAWFFDSELLIVGEKTGYKIFEEPVKWVDNAGSTVRVFPTVTGDLLGLWRLFWQRPWNKIKRKI